MRLSATEALNRCFASRLEPHRRARLGRKLLAIALYRPLDRAQADDDALLGCQLLADHVGIAVAAGAP